MLITHEFPLSRMKVRFCPYDSGERIYAIALAYGRSKCGHTTPFLARKTLHLHFVISGAARFDGVEVGRGDIFCMDRLNSHRIEVISDEDFEQFWFEFDGSGASALIGRTALSDSAVLRDLRLVRLFGLLEEAIETDLPGELLSAKLTGLLLYALAQLEPTESTRKARGERGELYVRGAVEFMRSNLRESITVEMAARSLGITEKHLYKLFIAQLGVAPMAYLRELRCELAAKLLTSTDLPITTIAAEVGLGDQSYFSRFFKKYRGCSPSEYRERGNSDDKREI